LKIFCQTRKKEVFDQKIASAGLFLYDAYPNGNNKKMTRNIRQR